MLMNESEPAFFEDAPQSVLDSQHFPLWFVGASTDANDDDASVSRIKFILFARAPFNSLIKQLGLMRAHQWA